MIYLIDGHNLIGQMPDISLSDVDDEMQLLRRLENWSAGSGERKLHVVFDSGRKGSGQASSESSKHIKVEYVRRGVTADTRILQILRNAKNVKQYVLVTSDREVKFHAAQYRIMTITSAAFVRQMIADRKADLLAGQEPKPKPKAQQEPINKPQLSEEQVENWLQLFENAPKPAARPQTKQQKPVRYRYDADGNPLPTPEEIRQREAVEAARYIRPVTEQAQGDDTLTNAELSEWMTLFSDAPKPARGNGPTSPRPQKPKKEPKVTLKQKQSDSPLSQDDLELWLKMFGD